VGTYNQRVLLTNHVTDTDVAEAYCGSSTKDYTKRHKAERSVWTKWLIQAEDELFAKGSEFIFNRINHCHIVRCGLLRLTHKQDILTIDEGLSNTAGVISMDVRIVIFRIHLMSFTM
jgi:hypothetical protein